MFDKLSSVMDFVWSADAAYQRGRDADRAQGDVQRAQNFTREQMQNKYQWQVADLKAAGLNPALAYGQAPAMGGSPIASGAGGSPGVGGEVAARGSQATSARIVASAQAALMADQARNVQADTEVKNATAEEIRARTPTHGVSIEKMRQEVAESIERMQTYAAQAKHHVASAAQADQQVVNLQAMLPQISATVGHLRALTALEEARIPQVAAQIGKTKAETKEILQRVKENLPQIEAMVKEMEFYIKQAGVAGAQRAGEVRGVPVLGHVAELLRMFNPLAGILGGN